MSRLQKNAAQGYYDLGGRRKLKYLIISLNGLTVVLDRGRRRPADPEAAFREEAAMVQENSERLKKYLDMISRKEGGIEGVMHKLSARRRPGEESVEGMRPTRSKSAQETAHGRARNRLHGARLSRRKTSAQLEAIIFEDIRPAIDRRRRHLHCRPIRCGRGFLGDAANKARIEAAIPLVGRIELPGKRYSLWRHRLRRRAGPDHDQPPCRGDFRRRPRDRSLSPSGWLRRRASTSSANATGRRAPSWRARS